MLNLDLEQSTHTRHCGIYATSLTLAIIVILSGIVSLIFGILIPETVLTANGIICILCSVLTIYCLHCSFEDWLYWLKWIKTCIVLSSITYGIVVIALIVIVVKNSFGKYRGILSIVPVFVPAIALLCICTMLCTALYIYEDTIASTFSQDKASREIFFTFY